MYPHIYEEAQFSFLKFAQSKEPIKLIFFLILQINRDGNQMQSII